MQVTIVGAGISGLALALALERGAAERGVDLELRVLEGESTLGGKLQTRKRDGFIVESAANGWLDTRPHAEKLVAELRLGGARLPASDAAQKRFLFKDDALRALPTSAGGFIGTGLLSLGAKFRILRERWVKPGPPTDESVADFVLRRLGKEALETLVEPMVTGIYAGDPYQMSVQACFPKLVALEREHGGLFRGMKALRRARKNDPTASPQGGMGGRLTSLRGGIHGLVEALRAALTIVPESGQRVQTISRNGAGYRLKMAGGSDVASERVVLASPAWASAKMLDDLDSDLARELSGIPYPPVTLVAMAWRERDLSRPLDGFGFLVPKTERRAILGCLWDSTIFSDRAPDGYALTRTMVGGVRQPELANLGDQALADRVREELQYILGITAAPELVLIERHPRAIPQYPPGHHRRLETLAARLEHHRDLYLAGNAYRGVSLDDCARRAPELAAVILEGEGPAV